MNKNNSSFNSCKTSNWIAWEKGEFRKNERGRMRAMKVKISFWPRGAWCGGNGERGLPSEEEDDEGKRVYGLGALKLGG